MKIMHNNALMDEIYLNIPKSKRKERKRSPWACGQCRLKKVRCDVAIRGSPCSNCTYDTIGCDVPTRKKYRRPEPEQNSICMPESLLDLKVSESSTMDHQNHKLLENQTTIEASTMDVYQSSFLKDLEEIQQLQIPEDPLLQSWLLSCSEYDASNKELWLPPSSSTDTQNSPKSGQKNQRQINRQSSKASEIGLPSIFKPLPSRLDADDISHLRTRDAFSVPGRYLQSKLLKSYRHFVHAKLPVLSLDDFTRIAALASDLSASKKGQLSLLLFQAVMFAGVAFVDMKYLYKAGFRSRENAKCVFFNRVMMLYNFDCEIDRISIIQSLLLMTSSPVNSADTKSRWHWLGLAISLCYSVGLHRDLVHSSLDRQQHSLRKRIWWTCFVQDRLIALAEGKPLRIKRDDFRVSMLCSADLDLRLGIGNIMASSDTFIEKAILCWCTSDRLISQIVVDQRGSPSVEMEHEHGQDIMEHQLNAESMTGCDEIVEAVEPASASSKECDECTTPEDIYYTNYYAASVNSPQLLPDCQEVFAQQEESRAQKLNATESELEEYTELFRLWVETKSLT